MVGAGTIQLRESDIFKFIKSIVRKWKKKLKANTLNHKLDILYHLIHIENNVGKPIKLVGMTSEEASS